MAICINKYKINALRGEHQWMSAKVPSLEADSFFIKINCVAGAAYLSMPPADTCPPPTTALCVCVCVHLCEGVIVCAPVYLLMCVCIPMLSNNGSFTRHCLQHVNKSEGNSNQKAACYQRSHAF